MTAFAKKAARARWGKRYEAFRSSARRYRAMNGAEYLSPNYRANQVDLTKLDDRIRVYEDQIRGWFLEPAKALLPVPNSSFAVLHILMGYFEHHAIYRYGKTVTVSQGRFSAADSPQYFLRQISLNPPCLTLRPSRSGSRMPCTVTRVAGCSMVGWLETASR